MSTSQRQVWGETLVDLANKDWRLVVLDGDLANSTKAQLVADQAPDAFIEMGIAEQNMVGMAAGLSTLGYRPWLSSFSVFLTHRAVDQVRMLVSQTKAPVRISAGYTGLLNGSSGKTHQDIEDLAIMRAMPNMTVIAPADAFEAEAVTRWAAEHDGPVYIRYARDAVDPVYESVPSYQPGPPIPIRDGTDLTMVSTGVQTSRTLEAATRLAAYGIDAAVIHVPTLKPFDDDVFFDLVGQTRELVTVEEHSRYGCLGGLISEVVAGRDSAKRVTRIGLEDKWSESAPNDFLLDRYGLSAERVKSKVRDAVLSGNVT